MGILDDGLDSARLDRRKLRARTIAVARGRSALFRRPALLLLAALAACNAPPRENSYHRAARERRLDRLTLMRQQQDQTRLQLQTAIVEDRHTIDALRDEAAMAASRRRDAEFAYRVEQRQLAQQQADLVQARAQRAAVQADIDAVRGALADVQVKELKLKALGEQRQRLDAQIAAAERELAEQTAHLQPRLVELRTRTDKTRALNAQVAAALEQLQPPVPPAADGKAPAAAAAPANPAAQAPK
jgi:chromosome segregation ATPase